jgi:hypothetical protein
MSRAVMTTGVRIVEAISVAGVRGAAVDAVDAVFLITSMRSPATNLPGRPLRRNKLRTGTRPTGTPLRMLKKKSGRSPQV